MPPDDGSLGSSSAEPPLDPETTIELLQLAKAGDGEALERLLERCLPPLQRWAHGRLPPNSRGMLETADIVQDAVMSAMRHLGTFEPRHQGALQAYLRRAVLNRIRDIIRRTKRRPQQTELPDDLKDEATSPLDELIGEENAALYDEALERLDDAEQEAIIGRLEMGYSYQDLAIVLAKPSADAARMAVTRALKHLAKEMRGE
ncbi:MAG TPA: sigma-70 family RNA polymerase sigma factor [Vicinamibacterales bacterium]|nr:sigma-70 family RNA polymerase sigma factor [Vicinamibacterales bacterium]